MFAPRAVQPPTRDQAPAHTRQTAEGPTHGLTPSEHVRGSVPFLQRYLGNSSLQSHVTGSKTPQEAAVPSVVHDVVRSPGQPLDPTTRTDMEARFHADFSQARVHTDTRAVESAQAVGALAYTVGSDIVFGVGAYRPGTPQGRHRIAHELAHTLQQPSALGGQRTPQEISHPGDPAEREADRAATSAMEPRSAPVTVHAAPSKVMRQPVESPVEEPPQPETKPEPASKRIGRSYAVVFPHDKYGQNALAFIRKYQPNHKVLRPASLESLMQQLKADIDAEATRGLRLHVDELMLVTHANRYGGMFVPIRRADVGKKDRIFTPENFQDIQETLLEKGEDKRFEDTRHFVATQAIDEDTRIVVRGCEFGQDAQAPDALALFFGGTATVWAPVDYQGYGPGPTGDPTSYYVRGEENKKLLKQLEAQGKTFSEEAEALRIREEDKVTDEFGTTTVIPNDVGGQGESQMPGDHFVTTASPFHNMRLDEIETRAKSLLDTYDPTKATALRILRKAWEHHPQQLENVLADTSGDPLFGLFAPQHIFGDPAVIDADARRHPNAPDLFTEISFVKRDRDPGEAAAAKDFSESMQLSDPALAKAAEEAKQREIAQTGGAKKAIEAFQGSPGGDRATRTPGPVAPHEITMEPAEIKGQRMPGVAREPFALEMEGGSTKTKAAVILVPRGNFKRSFAIPVAKKLGILQNVEAEVMFDGTIEFTGTNVRQIDLTALGQLGTKTGESTSQRGGRAEGTIVKRPPDEQGRFINVKGGVEGTAVDKTKEVSGDPAQSVGQKLEFFVSTEVGWGPISTELKVTIFGIDTTKSGSDKVKVLEVKWSPVIISAQAGFTLPCIDGTSVNFKGKAGFAIKAEPDWAEIGRRVSQYLGRQVVVEATAVTAGTAAAAGSGATAAAEGGFATKTATAIGAGEALVTLGFLAVAAATVYAYVQSMKDIADLKTLQAESKKGVADFVSGFLVGMGYQSSAAGGSRIYNMGVMFGKREMDQALARSQARMEFLGYKMTADEAKQVREEQTQRLRQDSTVPARVYRAFEKAIQWQFYNAFKAQAQGRYNTAAGEMEIRGNVGVPITGDPDLEPDWSLIYGLTGSRPLGSRDY